jgi:hypothetical protein
MKLTIYFGKTKQDGIIFGEAKQARRKFILSAKRSKQNANDFCRSNRKQDALKLFC